MSRISLNGVWEFRQANQSTWLPATVPGCNFTDLLVNEKIGDPFYRDNELSLQWVELQDWEYRCNFEVKQTQLDSSEVLLIAEGLDTFCDVFLNGIKIATSDNMFVGLQCACKAQLKHGSNELLIRFRSPINEVMQKFQQAGFVYPAENDKTEDKLSVYCRKAPCHFGWDWGPRFVSSGIWRDIYLEFVDVARIESVAFEQKKLSSERAEFAFKLDVQSLVEQEGLLKISCAEVPELSTELVINLEQRVDLSSQQFTLNLSIDNPNLWWPNGLGDAFLYHFCFELSGAQGVLDSCHETVGFRTIEVVNEDDVDGQSFYISVNGHPVFMKGANYIPADSFIHRVTPDIHRRYFDAAVSANMNMLRVWGGGVYQDNDFYRLADENGILIWQDFMFACSLYPGDTDFINNVQAEAEYNIRRLRNHPCIALWCGNNEVAMGIEHWQWQEKFGYSDELYADLKKDYQNLFEHCLPNAVSKYDPQRFYLPSSPIGFWEADEDNKANHHYWGVWHGEEPFTEYQKRIPRFMSEFGFQSFPLRESIDHFTKSDDLALDSDVMSVHQKHPRGNGLIRKYMQAEYQEPNNFDALLFLSQVQQAEGLKLAFEAHRAAMPFCMGSLYWQLNDTWPAASWSSIDYYGRWKALQYQAARSFNPQILVATQDSDSTSISLVSDKLSMIEGKLLVELLDMRGQVLESHIKSLVVKANAAAQVFSMDTAKLLSGHARGDVVLQNSLLDKNDQVITQSQFYFVAHKDLNLLSPTISFSTEIDKETLIVELKSDVVVRHCYVSCKNSAENFSDNFFDLIPGQTKTISLSVDAMRPKGISDLAASISVMSLIDTYLA